MYDSTLRHAAGADPLLAVCPQWAFPRCSEALSNPECGAAQCQSPPLNLQRQTDQFLGASLQASHVMKKHLANTIVIYIKGQSHPAKLVACKFIVYGVLCNNPVSEKAITFEIDGFWVELLLRLMMIHITYHPLHS